MRVCIDVQSAVAQRAGVGRYTRNLVRHLAPLAGPDALRLFYFDFRRHAEPPAAQGAEVRAVRWVPGAAVQQMWKRHGWPPAEWFMGQADLYHFPNFVIPPLRCRTPSVVTIHDVSFLRYPEFTEERNLAYLNARVRDTVDRAAAILTVSRSAAADVEAAFPAARGKTRPTPLGIDPCFASPPPATQSRQAVRDAGIDRPYLLTVGTVEPRKNLPFLIEVFERLTAFDGLLVIAGMMGWKYEPILARIRASPRVADIRYLEFVPDAQLPNLYAGAEAFLFTSHYEGFGLPPLEAMACGTPVVSSTGGSLAEVLGNAAVCLDRFDPEAWVAAVQRVLTDSEQRQTLRERGIRQAAGYSWQETALRTWAAYRAVTA